MKHALIALAFALAFVCTAATTARAETVYRCGHEYGDAPCADAKVLVVADAVSPAQRAEARQVALREKALAAEMTRDRRAEEAMLRPAPAGSLSGPRVAAEPAAPAPKKHAKKRRKSAPIDDARDFVAIAPKPGKAKH